MLYKVEKTVYCMQLKPKQGTLGTDLRYGLAKGSLRTIKIYDYKYNNRTKKFYKFVKNYKVTENMKKDPEHKEIISEVKVNHEGKPRDEVNKNLHEGTKYVQIIPHESCPDNFIVLEITQQPADENNNKVTPKVMKNSKEKRYKKTSKRLQVPHNINERRNLYNKVVRTLQVPRVLGAKTSILWKTYENRRKLMKYEQRYG